MSDDRSYSSEKMVVVEKPYDFNYNAFTNPDKELIKINIAYRVLKYVIFGTGIIILMVFAADVFLSMPVFTGQAPDIVDHVYRIGGLTIPLISFILGHIFGKSQN
jgi:hypothetical protein